MNLKGQELKHGRNKLVLQNSSYYHVRVFSQTLQYEQLLQTIIITKYFHMYLFGKRIVAAIWSNYIDIIILMFLQLLYSSSKNRV